MREVLDDFDKGLSLAGRKVNNLRYADDTTLITDNAEDMSILLNKLDSVSKRYGLFTNTEKTKSMSIGEPATFHLNGISIERVDNFCYWGSRVYDTGGADQEIRMRIGQGKGAMSKLIKVWKNKNISKITKKRLIEALVFPVVMYGCESWRLTAESRRKINAFEMWCWRRMLRISYLEHRTNNSVITEVSPSLSLLQRIAQQSLRYFGHICRRTNDNLEKLIMQGKINGKRSRGRPRARYSETIRLLGGFGSMREATRATSDRASWKAIVRSARP